MLRKLLLAGLFCLVLIPVLRSEDAYKVMEQVRFLKSWLDINPKLEDVIDPQISPQQLEERKEEIRGGIRRLLASSSEPRKTTKIKVLGYSNQRGALSVDNLDLNQHYYFAMPYRQAEGIIKNPKTWYLTAIRELNWELEWIYKDWKLQGAEINYAQQPEPVYTIPPRLPIEYFTEPQPDINERLLSSEANAYHAYQRFQAGDYPASLNGFDQLIQASPEPNPVYYYWLGRSFLALDNVNEGQTWLKLYLDSGDASYTTSAKDLMEIINRQYHIFRSVDKAALPRELVTNEGESRYTVHPVDGSLWFSSARPADFNGSNLWRAEKTDTGWANPMLVKELCSNADEAPGSFSPDGKTLWIAGKYDSGRRDFDILSSSATDSLWTTPLMLRELNSSYDDIDPLLIGDKVLIFSSSRPEGQGGFDLWYSELKDSLWQTPVNLGPAINTAGDEDSPWLSWDGKTLYFSSNGYPGLGGHDIYKTVKLQSGWQSWSLPENLGPVINTPARERGFLQLKDTNQAIRVSERAGYPYGEYLVLDYAPRSYWSVNEQGYAVWQQDQDKTSPLTGTVRIEAIAEPKFYKLTISVTASTGQQLQPELKLRYLIDGISCLQTARPNQLGLYETELPLAEVYTVECSLSGYKDYRLEHRPGAESSRQLDVVME